MAPVTVNSARTPVRSAHSATVPLRACGSPSFSRATGARLCTERRASPRLWRARAEARSRWVRAVGRSGAFATTWSWAMMPVRPWAMVSWISAARRRRSSATPASRAWSRSWAWRAAFSSRACCNAVLVRSSSAMVTARSRERCSSCSMKWATTSCRTALTTTSPPNRKPCPVLFGGSPPDCEPAMVTAAANTPSRRQPPGSSSSASIRPVAA